MVVVRHGSGVHWVSVVGVVCRHDVSLGESRVCCDSGIGAGLIRWAIKTQSRNEVLDGRCQ